MGFDYEAGGDASTGASWVSEPGTYHFIVTDVDETPTNKDGQLRPNAAFAVSLSVGDGTVAGQQNKTMNVTFYHPKPDSQDGGAMVRKKMDRLFIACGLVTEEEVKHKVRKNIDLQDLCGRQFIAQLEEDVRQDGKRFLQIRFAEIYHVDDPAMQAIPRNKELLAIIDPKLRRLPGRNGDTLTPPKAPPKQPAAASSVDCSDV